MDQTDAYRLSFNNVYEDYSGASWISRNSKGAKWLSQFLGSYRTSTNINIRAVAYMMDTNEWSKYYTGSDAEYAMGGPTIEMFCASYKDTHPSKYLECRISSSYYGGEGYQVRWNGGSWSDEQSEVSSDYNQIYIKPNSRVDGMWLASPSASDSTDVMCAAFNGSVSFEYYSSSYSTIFPGFRPIVCLKSDVQLEKVSDGKYQIVH